MSKCIITILNQFSSAPSPSYEPQVYSPDEMDAMVHLPTPIVSQHSGCKIHLPACYTDFLPLSDINPPLPTHGTDKQDQHRTCTHTSQGQCLDHSVCSEWHTDPNEMGLFQVYPSHPTLIPMDTSLTSVTDAPTLQQQQPCSTSHSTGSMDIEPKVTEDNLFSAFSNPTAGLLMCWHYSGSNAKSIIKLNQLVTNFTGDPLFNPTDSIHFSYEWEKKLVKKYLQDHSNPFQADHRWIKLSVKIWLPKEGVCWCHDHVQLRTRKQQLWSLRSSTAPSQLLTGISGPGLAP